MRVSEKIIIDARSASSSRTTGWERVARSVVTNLKAIESQLDLDIYYFQSGSSVALRLRDDIFTLPMRARDYQIYHALTYPPPPAVQASRAFIVYTVYDASWWTDPQRASVLGRHYYRRVGWRALSRANMIVTISATVRTALIGLDVPESKISVIHPGATVLPSRTSPLPAFAHRPYVLFVGTREPRKNLDLLLRAFQEPSLRGYDLVLAGRSGWGGVTTGRVRVVDRPSDETLGTLIRFARLVVLPSLDEGFGLPVVESLLLQTPVLCSDISAHREVGASFVSFFDPHSLQSLVEGLEACLATEVVVPAAVAEEYQSRFSWATAAEKYAKLYTAKA